MNEPDPQSMSRELAGMSIRLAKLVRAMASPVYAPHTPGGAKRELRTLLSFAESLLTLAAEDFLAIAAEGGSAPHRPGHQP